jgi:23S rRNA (guanosine2251-2'-O)-methyltransferase
MSHPSKTKLSSGTDYYVYGINSVLEILAQSKFNVVSVTLMIDSAADKDPRILKLLKQGQTNITKVSREKFTDRFGNLRTQGIIVNFSGKIVSNLPRFENIDSNFCLLVLDQIEDPQNLGQIIRTADCAGVNGIILTRHHSAGITNTALQVSQGAFCHIPIYESGNLHRTLELLKTNDFWITGIENSIDSKPWYALDYTGKTAIVFGSEGSGIRKLVLATCDFIATIPMQGQLESLNVTAAVSAVVFERQRQLMAIQAPQS